MGYKNIRCPHLNSEVKEFIVDTDADFETLPPACTGSTAVSLESGKVMVVNTQGKWQEFGVPLPPEVFTIEWDGNTEGLATYNLYGKDYYKLSDRVFTLEEFEGAKVVLEVDGVTIDNSSFVGFSIYESNGYPVINCVYNTMGGTITIYSFTTGQNGATEDGLWVDKTSLRKLTLPNAQ